MRKHLHTSAVILCLLASSTHAQFSEIWTNGDLFAVDQMASQCYSASVERCVAVGVTPNSPSWWNYLLGKNHAKLVSVKANISACATNYVNARTNALDLFKARDSARWTNTIHFLKDCGLATNALDETPWFKSQYASVTGGWVNAMSMLTNMTVSESEGIYYSETNGVWTGQGGLSYETSTNWGSSKAEAPSDWTYIASPFGNPVSYTAGEVFKDYYEIGIHGYVAYALTHSGTIGYIASISAPFRVASIYHCAVAPRSFSTLYDFQSLTFTNQGANVSNGWWRVGDLPESSSSTNVGLLVGLAADANTDPGFPPYWCEEPIPTTNYVLTATGWETAGIKALLNFTATTNGFKYR